MFNYLHFYDFLLIKNKKLLNNNFFLLINNIYFPGL